jgi:hypothetical protein
MSITGNWGCLFDDMWRFVHVTDELRRMLGRPHGLARWRSGNASKSLVEPLDSDHAAALDVDPDNVAFTALAEFPTATDNARRDAPAIAVCEV